MPNNTTTPIPYEVQTAITDIQSKLTQLTAFLTVSMGEDFTTNFDESVRSDYLWGCSDLCEQIHSDTESLAGLLSGGE